MTMSDWTIVNVAEIVTFIGGLIAGLTYLNSILRKWLLKIVDEYNAELAKTLIEINFRLDKMDKEATKNYLVQFISEVRRGESINETERQRFYEQYQHYTEDLKGNTYIKQEIENLIQKGYI